MQAKDLMKTNVLTCREDDSLERAAQLMWEGDIGAVPVLDAGGGVVGMITDRDICMAAYTQGCTLAARTVGSAMSRHVRACRPSDSIEFVEETMRLYQVRRLPIIEEGNLVGMLSLNDLALAAGNRKSPKGDHVRADGIATTLARVCEHRSALAAE